MRQNIKLETEVSSRADNFLDHIKMNFDKKIDRQ